MSIETTRAGTERQQQLWDEYHLASWYHWGGCAMTADWPEAFRLTYYGPVHNLLVDHPTTIMPE